MHTGKVQIKLFGNFEIWMDGNAALTQLKQAKKTSQFLQYLILKRDRPVPHEELLDMLWSENESSNPATALRTLLHRYRSLVEESGITALENSVLTSRGSYQWNPNLKCEVDVYEFERICQEARNQNLKTDDRMERYNRIVQLYRGPLLSNSAEQTWVVNKSVYYHDLYLESIFAMIDLLKTQDRYDEIAEVCRKAMDVDMFDERLHLELMMALVKTGKKREALSQYYFTSELHDKQPGSQPSDELRSAYRMIVEADQEMETDIEKVRLSLDREDDSAGAFVCDYEIFDEIYQLQRRIIERVNGTMFLALITVTSMGNDSPNSLVLDQVMKKLLTAAQPNLRRGDTISRYSATQYVVLLPSVNYETGRTVMERVRDEFYRQSGKATWMINYKLRPLCTDKYAWPGNKPKK